MLLELSNYDQLIITKFLCDPPASMRWHRIWEMMNEVKPFPLIPGLNMATIYQVAEYFDVPLDMIYKIEKRNNVQANPLDRQNVTCTEFEFLSLGKRRINYKHTQHWEFIFTNFSIHTAAPGCICYTPVLIERFLPYIQGSETCSAVLCKIIEKATEYYLPRDMLGGLSEKVKKLREKEAKLAAEKAKEEEIRMILKKIFAEAGFQADPVVVVNALINKTINLGGINV